MRLRLLPLFVASLVFAAGCSGQQPQRPVPQTMEMRLHAIAEGKASPSDMAVIYDDIHGLWGGVRTTVHGDNGLVEQHVQKPAEDPSKVQRKMTVEQLRVLAKLLLDIRAWEQQTPDREAQADESKTTLTVRVGAMESTIWEWHNDVEKNGRIAKVLQKIHEFAW